MQTYIGPSSTGKTRKLMELAKEHNAVFICGDPEAMERKALAYGIIGLQFMSYDDYINIGLSSTRDIVIDEYGDFWNALFCGDRLIGYTETNED